MEVTERSVSLSVPARADYLVLARLALSAVCRLTELRPDDVADLKLAITEAATGFVTDGDERLAFEFEIDDSGLSILVESSTPAGERGGDEELSRAIVAATVDDYEFEDRSVRLRKYLDSGPE